MTKIPTDLQAALSKACEEAAKDICNQIGGSWELAANDIERSLTPEECAEIARLERRELEARKREHIEQAKEVAAAIQSAVDEEREACAKIAMIPNGCACGRGSLYEGPAYCHLSTAAAIRARAQAKEKP